MRTIMPLLTIFFLVVILSCDSKESSIQQKEEFQFIIEGNVKNGNGKMISLYIPSQGLDNRIKSKIQDGKYSFKGKAEFIEEAHIRFEENILNPGRMFSSKLVFVEPGNIKLDFKVSGDSMLHYLDRLNVVKGPNNKFFYETAEKFDKASSYFIFSNDQKRIDSLHQFVYPEIRKNILTVYDSYMQTINSQQFLCIS